MSQIVSPANFPFEWFRKMKIQKRRKGNPGTKSRAKYLDIVTAFDIETTALDDIEQSIMYIWQWQFGTEYTVIGRTWKEFDIFKERLCAHISDGVSLVVYVHNLSYEFQFLRGIYHFDPEEVFAIKSRRVLKCTMEEKRLEFRCSYIHSNMSLAEYTRKMGAEHIKLSGVDFDYSKKRYPWTPLTEQELAYTLNDVLGLVEALIIEMQHDGDTLYTIPLTSTGYVRRDAKKAMRGVSFGFVRNQLPDYQIYQMCREAFRGGNTHANRYYAGMVLHDVKSADRSSSYPDVQCNCLFPISEFYYAGPVEFDDLIKLVNVRKRAVLMRVSITNIRLTKSTWGCPYLSRDKCRKTIGGIYDNGRILSADYLETTITDIDLKIILDEYTFDDMTPFDVAHARYGKLPEPLVKTTIEYYIAKTTLKNVAGEEIYYMKSKNKLNSIYGMMAQNPVKQSIDFIDDDPDGGFVEHQDNPEDILMENNRKAFLCYQWGVWVTAWARYRLEEGIRLAGDNFVYCDTDSVKYLGDIDWTPYNKGREKDSLKSGAHATDPQGVEHYMGVYEYEGCYAEFSTLGAKKYCYREAPGKPLKVTIAGVNKAAGGPELEKAGGISAFKPGFIFREAGGTESIYNDHPAILEHTVDGRTLPITSNIMIKNSTYTLGITGEYERLLNVSQTQFRGYNDEV